jgi:hypothetical protein
MSGEVITDETGLHAEECSCVICETGYRPTRLERATARRALALQRQAEQIEAEAKRKAEEAKRPRQFMRPMPMLRVPIGEREAWPDKGEIKDQISKLGKVRP